MDKYEDARNVVPGQKLQFFLEEHERLFGFPENCEMKAIKNTGNLDDDGWPIWKLKEPNGKIREWPLSYFFANPPNLGFHKYFLII